MRIYDGSRWGPRHLDPWRDTDDLRIDVLGWAVLREVEDQFFVRPASLALLATYLRDIGPRAVWRKIRSRRAEHTRNRKYVSVGLGRVVEGPGTGSLVTFIAPNHPLCVDRISLPRELTRAVADIEWAPPEGRLAWTDLLSVRSKFASDMDGWSPFSGTEPEPLTPELESLVETSLRSAELINVGARGAVTERLHAAHKSDDRGSQPSCTVIGLGNYAKTTLVPFLSRQLRVTTIHEIDPCQIGASPSRAVTWDTAPTPRESDRAECWAIAGYHHLHAPLAAEALRRGKYAIVEKPLAVTEDALDELLDAYEEHDARGLFLCFQRRYAVYNEWIRNDLQGRQQQPVDYHCIVFEEPLPTRHWYGWPSSGSRLTSNGCHWIDHFLFLNDYAAPTASSVTQSGRGTLNCSVELENGAFFTMALTDRGSPRLGVQDIVDVRCEDRTARITNSSEYVAEGRRRVVRRERVSKLDAYERMYRSVGRAVVLGLPGDSRRSLELPARVTQSLEGKVELA